MRCSSNESANTLPQRRETGVRHYRRRQQPRILRHLRAPHLQTTLRVIVSLLLLMYLFDVAVCLAAPCPFFEVGSMEALQAGKCVEEYDLILTVRMVGYLICLGAAAVQLCFKAAGVLRFPQSSACYCCHRGERERAADSSWVCAASPDLYQETLNSLRASNTLLGLTTIPFTLLLVATYLSVGIDSSLRHTTHPLIQEICGDSELCLLGKHWNEMLERAVLQMWGAASVHFVTTPTGLWGGVMTSALRQKGSPLVGCLQRAPYLTFGSFLIVVYQNLHREMRDVPNSIDAGPDVAGLFCVEVASLIYHLAFVWNSRLVQDTSAFVNSYVRLTCQNAKVRFHRMLQESPEAADSQGLCRPVRLQRAPTAVRIMHESSAGHRQELLIMIFALVLCYRVASGVPISLCVVVYASRVTVACLILLMREKECSFERLEGSPGFGLVVQASALRAALACALTGTAYRGRLPRYKATAERMEETLAVSYRWQVDEVTISPDCVLNMSRFQVEGLARAIKEQQCQYVWLDRLSVPQYECDLKYTLLARMMAVYAAAKATVAFRSLESPGSRYHERVWTCQEYCMAKRLQVVTEETGDTDVVREDGVMAVTADEEEEVEGLRERVQLDGGSVVPLWLRRSAIAPEVAKEVVRRYRNLSARLQCQVAADKVRALVPLLARAPVEGPGELVQLVLQLGRSSGEDLQQLKGDLLEQHLSLKWSTRAVVVGGTASQRWVHHSSSRNEDNHHIGLPPPRSRTLRRSHSLMDTSLCSVPVGVSEDGVHRSSHEAPPIAEEPSQWRPQPRRVSSAVSLHTNRLSWNDAQGAPNPLEMNSTARDSVSFSESAAHIAWHARATAPRGQRMLAMMEEAEGAASAWDARGFGSDTVESEHHLPVTVPCFGEVTVQPLLPGAVASTRR